MTPQEYLDRKVPEYYKTMYLDGYSPTMIFYAMRKKLRREVEESEAQKNQISNIRITSEVKIKK